MIFCILVSRAVTIYLMESISSWNLSSVSSADFWISALSCSCCFLIAFVIYLCSIRMAFLMDCTKPRFSF